MIAAWSAWSLAGDIVDGMVCGPAPGGPALLFAELLVSGAGAERANPPVMSAAMAIPSARRMGASLSDSQENNARTGDPFTSLLLEHDLSRKPVSTFRHHALAPQPPAAKIAQHLARRVVAGRAGHPAARVGAGAAHIKPRDRAAVIGMAEQRAGREQLPEIESAVENVAADEAESALEIERRENLPAEHRPGKIRRVTVDRRDHQVGDLIAMVVPRGAVRQLRGQDRKSTPLNSSP